MAIDISGINFFMPVFSFLFVFIIVFALLVKSKLLGDSKFVNLLVSFIMGIVFMSVSSLELYVQTVIPWFVVLLVVTFLVVFLASFSTKGWDKLMSPVFAWIIIILLVGIFLISAIRVFNPVFHPSLGIVSGEAGTSVLEQIKYFFSSSNFAGSLLLIITAIIVSWVLTKK